MSTRTLCIVHYNEDTNKAADTSNRTLWIVHYNEDTNKAADTCQLEHSVQSTITKTQSS